MLVRQFSPHGGLELYAHKVVEGLLENDIAVTVVCQELKSELRQANLDYEMIEPDASVKGKYARQLSLFKNANRALAGLSNVDLIHSQHCPTDRADIVTFHNHSTKRLSEVGFLWERILNDCKRTAVPAYKLREKQDEILLRKAQCLIFPAEVMKEDFFKNYPFLNGPPSKPYVVAHPGASLADENAGRSINPPSVDACFNFLFVGRGFRKKGLDVLLAACARLKRLSNAKFKLLIAGLKAKPSDQIYMAALGLGDCVEFLGFQKDMDAVYQKAKAIILPSRVEPFGMAPVQGMQRGLVPIVSKVSGVAEVLNDGVDALILRNHLDADELAHIMQQLLDNPELLQKLSLAAGRRAEKISWQETVKETIKAYDIALSLRN
ncbi:MAG: glycosyltransferase family 4 protein [Candidatus Obscuribacterales bacterium]|nr:glycosyltransferase family 4 protein [Candidatus Obscuribacterales bacterium]